MFFIQKIPGIKSRKTSNPDHDPEMTLGGCFGAHRRMYNFFNVAFFTEPFGSFVEQIFMHDIFYIKNFLDVRGIERCLYLLTCFNFN